MKTTIEIPDPLMRRAKAAAARRGQSLDDFLSEALADKLKPASRRSRAGDVPPWMAGFGELHHLGAETRRIQERIDAECRQIEPEDAQ
jgi:hypothetical protein